MNRRDFLVQSAALCAGAAAWAKTPDPIVPDTAELKRAALKSGKLLAMFTVQHELLFDAAASAMIANTFSMVADGNDLKFSNRLRPTPQSFDFSYGDQVLAWAEQHHLLFRGHALVWSAALPKWFASYVTPANAHLVMTDHITTVMKHYAGRVYSWDVVNEPIYHDNRADGLRRKPWLDYLGPEYIDLAFHTAAAADPKAKLVLNECYIEHDTPAEVGRRASLLALLTRLKKANVPVTMLGVQGHLRGNTPLDKAGMERFCKQVQDLGIDLMITELDVDDDGVPAADVSAVVARKYGEFLELMDPFVKVITFEALRDNPDYPRRADGTPVRPNLWNAQYQPSPAYTAVLKALQTTRADGHSHA